jgi:hypothetical protein
MLRTYTRLQLELVPHAAEMLALGVPDHRPSRLPALVADLLADDDARLTVARVDSSRRSAIVWWPTSGSTRSTAHASPTVASPRRSARRAARRERVRVGEPAPVLRLGDASVSHPFVRLLATLRMVARALDLENGHPVLLRLRDSFLDVWRGHGTPQQLRERALTLRVGRCSVR